MLVKSDQGRSFMSPSKESKAQSLGYLETYMIWFECDPRLGNLAKPFTLRIQVSRIRLASGQLSSSSFLSFKVQIPDVSSS